MYGLGYKDSALYNADVDTDRKGSYNFWLAQEGLRVRSEHGVLVCVGDQENSEKTEVGACRLALDLGRYKRANSVPTGTPELVQFPSQRCQQDSANNVGSLQERCSVEETRYVQSREPS